MEFLGSYLLFLLVGCVLIAGFSAFLFALNYILFPGPTWWAALLMAGFLGGITIAIVVWCIRNHRQEGLPWLCPSLERFAMPFSQFLRRRRCCANPLLTASCAKRRSECGCGKRSYRTSQPLLSSYDLWDKYNAAKEKCLTNVSQFPKTNQKGVFANNELDLSEINAYGFDYDYTIAIYTREVNALIYELALQKLIDEFKYPPQIGELKYNTNFAVRGLHYDITKGVLLKLDAFCQIQLGTVYRGCQPLSDAAVKELYMGTSVPDQYAEYDSARSSRDPMKMKQLLDLFSLPELGLISSVTEYFLQNNIEFDPQSLFQDVTEATSSVHFSGRWYRVVMENIERFLHKTGGVRTFFERLSDSGKQIFLVTNSPFDFVNRGMHYIMGKDWKEFFDFIIVRAKKPRFFTEKNRPFRIYNEHSDTLSWMKVGNLTRGTIYAGGNLTEFALNTNLARRGVLYFGDNMFADLAVPMLKYGWRTGGVIPELEGEIRITNSLDFRKTLVWLTTLSSLIETNQGDSEDIRAVLPKWIKERNELRLASKAMFNPQFGSIFRTYHNPSFFSSRLARLCDVYTSSLPNLLEYSLTHTFYPRRTALPHEVSFGNVL